MLKLETIKTVINILSLLKVINKGTRTTFSRVYFNVFVVSFEHC